MKASPVQLLQSTIDKISVEVNESFDPTSGTTSLREDIVLQVKEEFGTFAEYWDSETPLPDPGIKSRTFLVTLGIRTDPSEKTDAPYRFEIVCTGIVACMVEKVHTLQPDEAARQYGLAMIYGTMREQLLGVTSRMAHGPRLLPTVSFMEEPRSSASAGAKHLNGSSEPPRLTTSKKKSASKLI